MESRTEQLVKRWFIKMDGGPLPIHQYYFGSDRLKAVTPDIFHAINSREKEKGDTAIIRVCLEGCNIGDEEIKHISFLDLPNKLELSLRMNRITDVGCSLLVLANYVQNLTSLDLSRNDLMSKGCLTLSQGSFPQLRKLTLQTCYIKDQGCSYLGKLNAFSLEQLSLRTNYIEQKGCKGLSMGNWPSLSKIDLTENQLKQKGIAYLSKAHWTQLKTLIFTDSKIGDRGCGWLKRADMKGLTCIYLGESGTREKGDQYLAKVECTKMERMILTKSILNKEGKGCRVWSSKVLTEKGKAILTKGQLEK